ncbi:MAG: hypothetical protein EBR09_13740 [Proteobacteria bacterium]|nr:hypothetical protein [Pseudomonadota bacterium]
MSVNQFLLSRTIPAGIVRFTCISVIYFTPACTETTSYGTSVKTPKKKSSKNVSDENLKSAGDANAGVEALGVTFSGSVPFQSTASDAEAWVVTSDTVTRIKLNESAGWPKTTWSFVDESGKPSQSSGHRTYVSEIGLLVGRTARSGNDGGVWLASDKTAGKAIPIFRPTDQNSGSRLSVTSFKVGDKAFIGMAYGATGGKKKFVRIPIDKSKPAGIDVSKKEEVTFGQLDAEFGGFNAVGRVAAYGSFMDQSRKSFYLGANGGGLWGVNVEKMTELTSDSLPNANIEGRKICNYTMRSKGQIAYALAGDLSGNVITAQGAYTFTHDPVNNVVFGASGGSITVAKQECVTAKGAACSQEEKSCAVLNPDKVGTIGPMSATGDGRVVGIMRGKTSQVFVFSVKDKDDFSKGISVTKIADIEGDAYMYNDFTGLTLYAPDQAKTIDFKKLSGFQAGKPVRAVALKWVASSKKSEDLRGLKLQLVCYKDGKKSSSYKDVSSLLKKSEGFVDIPAKDCGGDIDMLEVKVSSDGTTNNFSRLSTIEMKGSQ